MSPALAGRFSTTAPPGKPRVCILNTIPWWYCSTLGLLTWTLGYRRATTSLTIYHSYTQLSYTLKWDLPRDPGCIGNLRATALCLLCYPVLMGCLSTGKGFDCPVSSHPTYIAGETKNRPHLHRTSKWSCFSFSDARDTALETFVLNYSRWEVTRGFRQQCDLFFC